MGFGWKDALELVPAYRAGEEAYKAGDDFSHGHIATGAEHVGLAGLNINPVTGGIMETIAVGNAVTGGQADDLISKPISQSLGVVDPLSSTPRDTPFGNVGDFFGDIMKNLKWIALVAGGIILLVFLFLILIR